MAVETLSDRAPTTSHILHSVEIGEKPTLYAILEEYTEAGIGFADPDREDASPRVRSPQPVIVDDDSGMQLVLIDLGETNTNDYELSYTCPDCGTDGLPLQLGTTVDIVPTRAEIGYRLDHHAHYDCDHCGTVTSARGVDKSLRGRLLGFAERMLDVPGAPPIETLFQEA